MKKFGLLLLFLGLSSAYIWRHDHVEGAYMVPIGIIVTIIGACICFEGLKREVMTTLKDIAKKD